MHRLDEIAAQLQGYDPKALKAGDAVGFLLHLASVISESETVPLKEALGRILAENITSPINVPAHDNSAMDGFAFNGSELDSKNEVSLRIAGSALAGSPSKQKAGSGECIKITTGAAMPCGLDTVIPMEFVRVVQDCVNFPAHVVKSGDNRRLCGEDIQQGSIALAKGTKLGPASLGLLASLGGTHAEVFRKLRVSYFSTGDEILSAGETPRDGAVYDSNRYTITGLLERMGVECIDMGLVKDKPEALEAALRAALDKSDAIITSGGVSVGEADYTKTVFQKMAGKDGGVVFWRIAIRPGRPMAVGQIGNSVLFGLPGNPVAAMVTFLEFVRPALLKMMGSTESDPPMLRAKVQHEIRKKPGRTEYQRAIVNASPDGSLQVSVTGQQGSGVLNSMARANGIMVLDHDSGNIAAGTEVSVQMFSGII